MLSNLAKQILYYLYSHKEPLSSLLLSVYCNASINTIRKEILLMNEILTEHGCSIISKQATGCQLIILNEKLASEFFNEMKFNKKMHHHLKLMEHYRSFYVIRYLLVSTDYTPAQKFSEMLHCSSSTITRDIRIARAYLKKFQLTICDRKSHGLFIQGEEWNQRLCLIEQHKLFCQFDQYTQNLETKFQRNLMVSSYSYSIFLKRFVSVLKYHPTYRTAFMNIPKLVIYLILCINRQNVSETMKFDDQQIQRCLKSDNYLIAKQVFLEIKKSGPYTFCKEDIITFTMLLCAYQSVTYKYLKRDDIFFEIKQEANQLIKKLSKRYSMIPFTDSQFKNSFICLLYTLDHQILFHIPVDEETTKLIEYEGLIAIDFCVEAAKYHSKQHVLFQHTDYLMELYYLFNHLMMSVLSNTNKYRVLICSQFGISYSQNVADRLKKIYWRFIQAIDVQEFDFFHPITDVPYDFILTDIHVNSEQINVMNPFHLPLTEVDFTQNLSKNTQLKNLFSHIYKKEALELLSKHIIFANISTSAEILDCIGTHYANDSVRKQTIITSIRERDTKLNSLKKNHIALLTSYSCLSLSSTISILINQTPCTWNTAETQIIVFYFIDPTSLDNFKTIHYILSKLFSLPLEKLLQLTKCKSVEAFLSIIDL